MSIKDKLDYLQDTKQAIKTAIQGKGQSVSDTDTFRSYADKINAITTGGGVSENFAKYAITQVIKADNSCELQISDSSGGLNDYMIGVIEKDTNDVYLVEV